MKSHQMEQTLGPVQAIRTCFARPFQFSGWAGRAEFWWFDLFQPVAVIAAILLDIFVLGLDLGNIFALPPLTEAVALILLFFNVVILIAAIFPGKPGSDTYGPNLHEVPQ
jgi:uncharacterized membrane protein YhaH (DUF805 family)